jgi:hypothetical protein
MVPKGKAMGTPSSRGQDVFCRPCWLIGAGDECLLGWAPLFLDPDRTLRHREMRLLLMAPGILRPAFSVRIHLLERCTLCEGSGRLNPGSCPRCGSRGHIRPSGLAVRVESFLLAVRA